MFLVACHAQSCQSQEKLNQWYGKIFAQLQADMSDSSLASVHEWMERTCPNTTAKNPLMTEFSNLESECRKILAAPDNGTITSDVPEVLVHNDVPVRFKIRLRNFGFLEDSQLKGPVQSYALSLGLHACLAKRGHVNIHVASLFSKIPGLVQLRRDNIQKFMTNQKGNQTNKYPLEILFDYVCKLNQHPVKPGSVIPAFSIAMFIGSSTIMSSFLLCIYACKLKILDAVKGDLKLEREVATRLLSCLVIHCTAVTATNHDQAMLNAFAQKREALTRIQPSLFQHYSVYQRILAKRPPARGPWSQRFITSFGCFQLCKGSILQKDDFLLVADMLMYDSEPGKGCVELNCGNNKEVPRLAFVGVSWAHEKGGVYTFFVGVRWPVRWPVAGAGGQWPVAGGRWPVAGGRCRWPVPVAGAGGRCRWPVRWPVPVAGAGGRWPVPVAGAGDRCR